MKKVKLTTKNMKTFKNINFKKRDYECTNVVFCKAEYEPDANWVECEEIEIEILKCDKLYKQGDVIYFVFL